MVVCIKFEFSLLQQDDFQKRRKIQKQTHIECNRIHQSGTKSSRETEVIGLILFFFLCLVLLYVCVRVFSLSLSTWISSQREAGVSCYYCTVDAIATRSLRFSVINFTAQLMLVHNLIDSLRTVSFVVLHSVPLVHKCT